MHAPLTRLAIGLACAAGLALSAPWWGPTYCAALLPLVEAALRTLAPPWAVQVALAAGEQPLVVAHFETASGFACHGYPVPPGAWVNTQTLQGYWWQHPVIVLGLWAGWPVAGLGARLVAAGAVLAVLPVLALLDLPVTLYGALTDLLLAGTAPQVAATSVPVQAMRLLEGGGRAAVCLAVGVAVLAPCAGIGRAQPRSPARA